MVHWRAREIATRNLPLSLPYYRFDLTPTGKSDQHELLLDLDDGSNLVYYAAPRFHLLAEINGAWRSRSVGTRSIFIPPARIGQLDVNPHRIAYDSSQAWLCSEPHRIEFLDSHSLVAELGRRLDADPRPLREKIPEFLQKMSSAERRAAARFVEKHGTGFGEHPIEPEASGAPPIPTRMPRELSEPEKQLRDLSDTAARIFDTQLIIVQPPG
jgi:hypothetical protein